MEIGCERDPAGIKMEEDLRKSSSKFNFVYVIKIEYATAFKPTFLALRKKRAMGGVSFKSKPSEPSSNRPRYAHT